MSSCFLLRFEESCQDVSEASIVEGTHTQTYVRREQPDSDEANYRYRSIPKLATGTQTGTRIRNEQPDDDVFLSARCLPVAASSRGGGTKTVTNVRAEASDDDPSTSELRAIPRCSSC